MVKPSKPRFVNLNADNIEAHHLCCALGDPKHEDGVSRKKAWLKKRFAEGLVFRKLDVRGKVFIEYAPSEVAWRPIVAPGWMTIHCLWVSGRYAKHGYGRSLVEYCVGDATKRNKHGVVVAAATTKRPFLSDPKFLRHLGFEEVDRAGAFRLFAKSLDDAKPPRFSPAVHAGQKEASDAGELVARFTDQCPFNLHWSQEMADVLGGEGFDVRVEHVRSRAKAKKVASPLGTFGLERDGTLITHHLTTEKAMRRLLGLPTHT